MNTQHLREFIHFSKCLNMAQTARELYITRPTLRDHIAELESELDCELVKRTDRGDFYLTDAGVSFVREAEGFISRWQSITKRYAHTQDWLVHVQVSASNMPWFEERLHRAKQTLAQLHEPVHLSITTTSQTSNDTAALESDIVQMALMSCKTFAHQGKLPIDTASYEQVILSQEPIYFVAGSLHPLFNRPDIFACDITGETIMLPEAIYDGYQRDGVLSYLEKFGAKLVHISPESESHYDYFTHGFDTYLGVCPQTLAPRFGLNTRNDLRIFTLCDVKFESSFFAVVKKDWLNTRATREFWQAFCEAGC